MKVKVIIPSVLFAVVSALSIIILLNKDAVMSSAGVAIEIQNSDIILFYGDGCPHCALVEEYINQNGIEAKITFSKKEVYNNKQNADDLVAKARVCGMPTDSVGVPFLWDGSTCFLGDRDIIEFFRSKIAERPI